MFRLAKQHYFQYKKTKYKKDKRKLINAPLIPAEYQAFIQEERLFFMKPMICGVVPRWSFKLELLRQTVDKYSS